MTARRPPPTTLQAGSHYGDAGPVRRWGPLVVAESRYPPRSDTPRHAHETASFTFLLDGSYVEEFPGSDVECAPGSLLFRPAHVVHRDRVGTAGARCVMVEVPPEWLRRLEDAGPKLAAPRQTRDRHGFAARIRRELRTGDEMTALALEALAMELACDVQRQAPRGPRPPRWLDDVRERVAAGFADLPSLEELAIEAGVHPAHMARSFRRHFGCTIGGYARRRRIEFCSEQLRGDGASLGEIAARAGFASQAHFTRSFKLHTDMTPGEFRRQAGGSGKPGARRSSG